MTTSLRMSDGETPITHVGRRGTGLFYYFPTGQGERIVWESYKHIRAVSKHLL